MKQDRNAACKCGSGKKAKRCCLLINELNKTQEIKTANRQKLMEETRQFLIKVNQSLLR